jgi:hypothetical protein
MDATEKDKALTHYRGLLARLEDAELPTPLTRERAAEHDRSLSQVPMTYDEIIAREA